MKYNLNDNEMNYILDLLADRPYKESAPLIVNIQNQYEDQIRINQESQMKKESEQLEVIEKAKKYDELDKNKK
ncbi:hypothetical protein A5886_002142 [Enterococcus sp. 8G7_MSG3316]|uniref:Uncharacterized protein n=1 Tax=Candidatus Enterococcus testudinis TaxID=1834191 RepID=A0A242A7Y6_9ENTE|nr:hypothetical protein [Enterococcus sp. 8G7_MSG3316]OTN77062.1 hypothetical protein A5886_002142 [Enterococcus sp. 8G7_MSG3316]